MKFVLALTVFLFCCSTTFGQFQFENKEKDTVATALDASVYGPRLGSSESQTWQAGIVIQPGSMLENVTVTVPIPMNWPEQKVVAVREEKIDAALSSKIKYRTVNDGAREMILELGRMRPHRKVEIMVEVELLNYELLPPLNPDDYVISKRPRGVEPYLRKSPKIDCDDSRFLKMYHEITQDRDRDWDKVEAIYSYVQSNVKYDDSYKNKEAKGALAVISMPKGNWQGDCKDMCCLFVAICRAGKIPARLVRVPEHCYAEFYLELKPEITAKLIEQNRTSTKRGPRKAPPQGFWFPCQVAGTYSFGGIPERQPILQKGDSFPDPDGKTAKGKKLFLTECFEGTKESGSPDPKFDWIKQLKAK